MKLLILGAGYSGKKIAKKALQKGAEVMGTTRSVDGLEQLSEVSISPIHFDGETVSDELKSALKTATHMIISIAPPRIASASGIADPVIAAMGDKSLSDSAPDLKWIGYLSTVGVYGNHDGKWVDETTSVTPVSERSIQRIQAEQEWQKRAASANIPLAIFRLSGIYGPGRNAFIAIENGKSRRLVKPGQVFNRIHVDDIATALNLAAQKAATGVFNITDDEPAPPQDVVTFAHKLAGKTPPPEIDFATADLTPMARSFYGENKRVSNMKSKEVLGMEYAYSNYRNAFTHMWKNNDWR